MLNGADVKDASFDTAIFACLSSAPPSLEASERADYYGLFVGNRTETADAEQAYTQAVLAGTETWVRLSKSRWPAHWHGKYRDPVVIWRLALYGHPDAGGYWEKHWDSHLRKVGFAPFAAENWPSIYHHPV